MIPQISGRFHEHAQNRMMKLEDLTENQIKHLKEGVAATAPIEAIRQPFAGHWFPPLWRS
jgi:hypothetical protein